LRPCLHSCPRCSCTPARSRKHVIPSCRADVAPFQSPLPRGAWFALCFTPQYASHRKSVDATSTDCPVAFAYRCDLRCSVYPLIARTELCGGERARMNLSAMLRTRADQGRPIRVALIGAGKFGTMYLAQARLTPGVHLLAIAD